MTLRHTEGLPRSVGRGLGPLYTLLVELRGGRSGSRRRRRHRRRRHLIGESIKRGLLVDRCRVRERRRREVRAVRRAEQIILEERVLLLRDAREQGGGGSTSTYTCHLWPVARYCEK